MEAAKDENWRYAMQEELKLIQKNNADHCTRRILELSGYIELSSTVVPQTSRRLGWLKKVMQKCLE